MNLEEMRYSLMRFVKMCFSFIDEVTNLKNSVKFIVQQLGKKGPITGSS